MQYAVKYRQSANAERIKFCEVYGTRACNRLRAWLQKLADDVASKQNSQSTNIDPEEWMRSIGSLRKNWERWWDAGARERFNAILYVLRNRKPPWEFRYAQRDLTVTAGVVDSIESWFEVDHANKRIVVTKLDVPPRD